MKMPGLVTLSTVLSTAMAIFGRHYGVDASVPQTTLQVHPGILQHPHGVVELHMAMPNSTTELDVIINPNSRAVFVEREVTAETKLNRKMLKQARSASKRNTIFHAYQLDGMQAQYKMNKLYVQPLFDFNLALFGTYKNGCEGTAFVSGDGRSAILINKPCNTRLRRSLTE